LVGVSRSLSGARCCAPLKPIINETMKIQPFAEADRLAVIRLWEETDLAVPQNDSGKDIDRKMKVDAELFLFGEVDGEVVATVMAGYEGHRGWINYLAVKSCQQRKGYGRILMEAAESLLRQKDCPKINLQARATNTEALEFYSAIGYGDDHVIGLGKRLVHDR